MGERMWLSELRLRWRSDRQHA